VIQHGNFGKNSDDGMYAVMDLGNGMEIRGFECKTAHWIHTKCMCAQKTKIALCPKTVKTVKHPQAMLY